MASPTEAAESAPAPREHAVNERAGRYLLELYWLSTNREGRVRTGEVSSRLDVCPSSVTEMLARLATDGLVDYRKQHGVVLTTEGVATASAFACRQCLASQVFDRVAGITLDPNTAYHVGYALPESVLEDLASRLDHPCQRMCRRTDLAYEGCLVESLAEG